jgi:hypothetical protein
MNPTSAARQLRARLDNPYSTTLGERVHLPGEPAYDAARTAWNLAADLRPAAVVRPHSAEEVAAVVRAAADLGLRVAPQSTGHGALPLHGADLSDVVLVKLDQLTGVSVDPEARTARVLGGTVWSEVVAAAAKHGLTAAHGSAGDVAVAGYALGGGVSYYARRHGLAVDSIRSVELVTAHGRLVHASATENPRLFRAVRGGGGNLGVVVSLEIELLPYETVYAGMLLWPATEAAAVARAWRDWCASAPEEVTTSLRVMSFPPLPELPPFLSGRDLVIVDGAVLADAQRAEDVLAPLRALQPELDIWGPIPAEGLLAVHMDPPGPVPGVSDHALLGSLPDAAVDALLASTDGVLFAELRQLGGALARRGTSAIPPVEAEFALYAMAMAPTPEAAEQGLAATSAVRTALQPWAAPGGLLTFFDRPVDTAEVFGDGWDELRLAVADADPGRMFVAAQRV